MNAVTMLWAGVAGVALTLAGVYGSLWLLDRRRPASLAFCAVAIGVAGLSIAELGMMHSASPAEYGRWVRWFHLPNFLVVAGLVAFVQLEFGTGRLWLATLIVGLRLLLLAVNFLVQPNVTWSEISSLRTMSFLGEQVSVVGSAVLRQPVQWAATVASLLFVAYVADALLGAWRLGERETRRKALVICGGILTFIALAILESQLVVWNVVQMPVIVAPPFLVLMAAITYELSRGMVASARMEREAQLLRDQLAHLARVDTVSQLSASLAHELRQPLTAILANARAGQAMLASGKAEVPELQDMLADIYVDGRRAEDIIQRTRALVKRSEIQFQGVSLAAVARDVLVLLRADAIQRGVTLEASVADAIPEVRADRVQLSQVLLNLIVNAMDAVCAESARERRVMVQAKRGRAHVEVAVADSGPGIPGDIVHRIFDSFVTTKPTGLGVGLAVSKAIVEAHGGQLWAENNPGNGATFKFTLPIAA
jgi:signal transduction histidine kinase